MAVIPKEERKPVEPGTMIGSFWETNDGRLAYFIDGQYQEEAELPELDTLPTDVDEFTKLIQTKNFVLTKKLSDFFRKAMDSLVNEVEEADASSVDSAD